MEKQKQIVFRRIGGRIVPIRVSGQKIPSPKRSPAPSPKSKRFSDAAKGGALVAAGVGVGALAGNVAARTNIVSAQFEDASRTFSRKARAAMDAVRKKVKPTPQLSFDFKGTKSARSALNAGVKSQRLFKNRLAYISAGSLIGGALIGAGAKKLYDSVAGKKKNSEAGASIAATSGAAGALAVRTAYYRRLSGGSILEAVKKAAHALKLVR